MTCVGNLSLNTCDLQGRKEMRLTWRKCSFGHRLPRLFIMVSPTYMSARTQITDFSLKWSWIFAIPGIRVPTHDWYSHELHPPDSLFSGPTGCFVFIRDKYVEDPARNTWDREVIKSLSG